MKCLGFADLKPLRMAQETYFWKVGSKTVCHLADRCSFCKREFCETIQAIATVNEKKSKNHLSPINSNLMVATLDGVPFTAKPVLKIP
jgi:hypothetical protein